VIEEELIADEKSWQDFLLLQICCREELVICWREERRKDSSSIGTSIVGTEETTCMLSYTSLSLFFL
jgi:hypothetical protein